ncbi:hypothetical protein DFJ73DRAFT_836700 [Zopfochytrium polystomum]|nr:hypothetical protein DFJ73DRAFT_836700 [Zopfochytrium polystomum]
MLAMPPPAASAAAAADDGAGGGGGGVPAVLRVPKGFCWVESDESFRGLDSNTFGPCSLGLVQARVAYVVWPPERIGPVKSAVPPSAAARVMVGGGNAAVVAAAARAASGGGGGVVSPVRVVS